jgi:NADH dehydrogenase FAD-containing subunit
MPWHQQQAGYGKALATSKATAQQHGHSARVHCLVQKATVSHSLPMSQVTLIDQSERFVFKPLLYELLNGTALAEEVAPSFTQLLAPYPIQFIQVGCLPIRTDTDTCIR